MNVPDELRYSRDHEWIRLDGDIATVGITDFAQDALGDVVYVEIPAVGSAVRSGDRTTEVESTKSVSEIYAPVSGEVTEVNEALSTTPESLNTDPYGEGWLFRMTIGDPAELDQLMSAAEYIKLIEG
jgi:glycine cleavage system H protein